METRVRAGIDIFGTVLRYAEVEQYGHRYRLLRLGSCYFEFDVAHQLLFADHPIHLDTIGEALYDVFSGSTASSLRIAVHPPDCLSFFSPLQPGLDPLEVDQLARQEAGLFLPHELNSSVRVSVRPIQGTGENEPEETSWCHVLAFPDRVYDRFNRILKSLRGMEYELSVSTQAASAVMARLDSRKTNTESETPRYSMAIGWYPTHVEYVINRNGSWFFSHHAQAQSLDDCLYFSVSLLQRLGLVPRSIEQLYVYGNGFSLSESPLLKGLFRLEPIQLNPIQVVTLDPASLSSTFDTESYVPCIGAVLH